MKTKQIQETLNQSRTFRQAFQPDHTPSLAVWRLGAMKGSDRQGKVAFDGDSISLYAMNTYLIAWKVDLGSSIPESVLIKNLEALYDWVHL